jgi:site-specific DNA-methyltransferase (adenine-specific)
MRIEHRSTKTEHLTPDVILDLVRAFAPIGLDPASCEGNPTKAKVHLTPERDGLSKPWNHSGLVFLNPPYGRRKGHRCKEWVDKAIEEARLGAEIIMLLPARTDTVWFQKLLEMARWDNTGLQCDILFIRGRLTFKGEKNGAPFPSALVHLGARWADFREAFKSLGPVL